MDFLQTLLIDIGKAAIQSEWPLVVGGTLIYLRKELRKAAANLEEISFGGGTAKFRRHLEKAAELVSVTEPNAAGSKEKRPPKLAFDAALPPNGTSHKHDDGPAALSQALLLPPPYLVMTAWNDLERAFYRAAGEKAGTDPRVLSRGPSLEQLASNFGMPTATIEFLHELRQLRNQAAHGKADEISLTDALRYRDLANQLIDHLSSIRPV